MMELHYQKIENLCSRALLKPFFSGEPVYSFKFIYPYICSVTQIQTDYSNLLLCCTVFLYLGQFHYGHSPIASPFDQKPAFDQLYGSPQGPTKLYFHGTKLYLTATKLYFKRTKLYLTAAKLYLLGTKLYFKSTKLYLTATKLYLQGTKLYFKSTELYLTATKLYLQGTKLYFQGTKPYLQGTKLYFHLLLLLMFSFRKPKWRMMLSLLSLSKSCFTMVSSIIRLSISL